MLSIKKSNLPSFLQESNMLICEVFDSNEETITVPKQYYISEINLNKIEDLDHILDVFRYWQVDKLPNSIYDFVCVKSKTDKEKINKVLERFNDYSCAKELLALNDFRADTIINSFSLNSNCDFVKYLYDSGYDIEEVLNYACLKKKLEIVKYTHALLNTKVEPKTKRI